MVLHGIVLLALARGLYLARHLPTLYYHTYSAERRDVLGFTPLTTKRFPEVHLEVKSNAFRREAVYGYYFIIALYVFKKEGQYDFRKYKK